MAICPAPIKPDERLKDWWVENPWKIAAKGKSLSGYERNRVYLNSRAEEFFEVSGVTGGADSDGDGRAVVPTDFNHDGMEDLIVRQAGGGSLLLFENRLPKANWLRVSLRGVSGSAGVPPAVLGVSPRTSSLALGARLTAEVAGRKIVRELYPHNTFKSQAPANAHFGLSQHTKIDRLTIRWPSGWLQELKDVPINRHLVLEEDPAQVTQK